MNKLCFVTGGTGFVGGRLIQRLIAQGWQVRALARDDKGMRLLQRLGAEPVRGSLTDASVLAAAMQGCNIVVHVAALFKLWAPAAEFEHANVQGTACLLKAAQAAGVKRLVQVGAAAVVMGDAVDLLGVQENAPRQQRRWAPYAASKARSEALVLDANRAGVFETLVIRPPTIWGDGMPMLDSIIASVQAGEFRMVNRGAARMSTVHVNNVCHAVELAMSKGRGGEAYFISDGLDQSFRDVFKALLDTRGVAAPDASVPFGMAWVMATVMENIWRLFSRKGEPPITRQLLRFIGKDFTLNISKAQRELGYQPEISWAEGVAAMRA